MPREFAVTRLSGGKAQTRPLGAGVFVTGTGTGVGKTYVAAAIARTLAGEGCEVAVFKPAVTGLDDV
ncbi:MAG TPA: AAA family ATPase, partial [Thermoanaerobaculia bacterium]|nr:AAA family ATPase [Thermoanaerobaculia bacterium]